MVLTARWTPLEPIPEQIRLIESQARFRVAAAGRRSGKTERSKRHLIECALSPPDVHVPTYVACAPTRDQAKRIWWQDLKDLSPPEWIHGRPSESELTIHYRTGSRIMVIGLDKPQRIEGIPIDGAAVDEIAECRPEAWTQSLRPALSTKGRLGWCWFTGRPRGRNHFYDLWRDAKTKAEWESFHWPSSVLLDHSEIEAARRDLDDLTFRQEYEADFISFEGRAYYAWDPNLHLQSLRYVPSLPLAFCFDFNVDPGTAAVVQDQTFEADERMGHKDPFQATSVIGEVFIERNSNTPAVCRRLCMDWAHHQGPVLLYGDATGTARKTSATEGNDWQQIRAHLRGTFQDLRDRVPRANPEERHRVNSVNTRLKNAAGQVRLFVDPAKAPNVVKDIEGVTLLKGGSGEIDKKSTPMLTHLTDALGYFVHERHPMGGSILRQY
jgi:Terminase large subunit, T4likevirus-type, N-terminal